MYPDNTVGTSKRTGAGPVNSFDVNSTVFSPIVGGIIAGLIVILMEWIFRVLYGLNQRKRGIKDISEFFGGWEVAINGNPSLQEKPWVISDAAGKDPLYTHRTLIRVFDFTISRWSKYLSRPTNMERNIPAASVIPSIRHGLLAKNSMIGSSASQEKSNGLSSEGLSSVSTRS